MSDVIFILIGMGLGLLMRLIVAFLDVMTKDIDKK